MALPGAVIRSLLVVFIVFFAGFSQGWAQDSFVEAERSRQRRGKAAMSLTEARQGRGRELEAEARQTKFETRPRPGDLLKKTLLPLDV